MKKYIAGIAIAIASISTYADSSRVDTLTCYFPNQAPVVRQGYLTRLTDVYYEFKNDTTHLIGMYPVGNCFIEGYIAKSTNSTLLNN